MVETKLGSHVKKGSLTCALIQNTDLLKLPALLVLLIILTLKINSSAFCKLADMLQLEKSYAPFFENKCHMNV